MNKVGLAIYGFVVGFIVVISLVILLLSGIKATYKPRGTISPDTGNTNQYSRD